MTTPTPENNGRNPFVVLIGFSLLGAALALLLFGGDLLRRDEEQAAARVGEVVVLGTPAAGQSPFAAASGDAPQIGDTAVDFLLNDFDNNPVSLSDFRGQPVIVNFWATWCAPCRVEMPEFQATYEAYQDQGLVILALNQDEPLAIARRYFYDEMGLTFTPLQDNRRVVAAQYGAFFTMPTTYFVNGDGVITAVHRGPLSQSQLENYLSLTIDDQG
jgi:cytochrome c biogenesis protein CcmG, thiol:disulfide interchange protein DsbE